MNRRQLPSQDSFEEDPGSPDSRNGENKKNSLLSPSLMVSAESMVQKVSETLTKLKNTEDLATQSCYTDLKYIWKLSRYTPDRDWRERITESLASGGIVAVFLKIWKNSHKVDLFNSKGEYTWKTLRNVLSIVWNCCDNSCIVCQELCEAGILPELLQALKTVAGSSDYFQNDHKLYYVKALFGILHNSVRNYPDCKTVLKTAQSIEILHDFFSCSHPMVKAKSLIVLSYLVDEEESDVISASSDTINFIVTILKESLSSLTHFAAKYGMTSTEIVKGLNNIAHNDLNKVKIVECGAVPMYTQLLLSESEAEQRLAAVGLWTLSFAAENKVKIKQDSKCIKTLQALAKNENKAVSHAARGALWEILHDAEVSPSAELEAKTPHVMISYQWDSQDIMMKVKDRLWHAGYKVWMDVEHMSGSTLEAMALAVEKAVVVLICMSEKYKQSPSCRTESEYIFRLRKDIVPLRLQTKYVPDGWLGMLVGSKLYFDFSKEELLDKQMPRLIKELGNRGKIGFSAQDCGVDGIALSSSGSSMQSESISQSASSWSINSVSDWLTSAGLECIKDRFAECDGSLLTEMKRIQRRAPEFFYTNLKSEFGLSFCEVLKLSKALDSL